MSLKEGGETSEGEVSGFHGVGMPAESFGCPQSCSLSALVVQASVSLDACNSLQQANDGSSAPASVGTPPAGTHEI